MYYISYDYFYGVSRHSTRKRVCEAVTECNEKSIIGMMMLIIDSPYEAGIKNEILNDLLHLNANSIPNWNETIIYKLVKKICESTNKYT